MVLRPRQGWSELRAHADQGRLAVAVPAANLGLTQTARVALLVADGTVGAVAIARRRQKSGAFDVLVDLHEIHWIEPTLAWAGLRRRLTSEARRKVDQAVRWNGILPPATARVVVETLDRMRPGLGRTVEQLRAIVRPAPSNPSPLETIVREQRDAVGLGLELAGVDSRFLPPAELIPAGVPFLRGLEAATVHEAASIRHDATQFPDWIEVESEHLDIWHYRDPDDPERRVTVLYADKGPLEQVTGTDLIYYREEVAAFVLVQYKRMRREEPSGMRSYRPDGQLKLELARMRGLGIVDAPPTAVWESRLSADPFYIKLVNPDLQAGAHRRLVPGMYFSLELFELLQSFPGVQGPKGGVAIGWHNAPRYLTNTQFIELVRGGWLGTRGQASALLNRLIGEVLRTGRGAIVVVDGSSAA